MVLYRLVGRLIVYGADPFNADEILKPNKKRKKVGDDVVVDPTKDASNVGAYRGSWGTRDETPTGPPVTEETAEEKKDEAPAAVRRNRPPSPRGTKG